MFGKHKKLYRLPAFLAVCCALFVFGSFFFNGEFSSKEESTAAGKDLGKNERSVYESEALSAPENIERLTNQNILKNSSESLTDSAVKFSTGGAVEPEKAGTYLITATNEKIVIYFIDEFGAKQFIQQTDIPYELLSETDQEMFQKGISLNSLTEVFELLQDFES